jgi:BON domain-containing protein
MARRRSSTMQPRAAVAAIVAMLALSLPGRAADGDEPRTNAFDDPFVQATHALAACPVAEGPLVTAAEARAQSHGRAERGTTCYRWGRCRLPNAYLYDKEIVPRVVRFISLDDRFASSTIWVLGQRRWVYLKGCVASAEQASALEREVRLIDDVEAVIDELMVGTAGKPPYAVARPVSAASTATR